MRVKLRNTRLWLTCVLLDPRPPRGLTSTRQTGSYLLLLCHLGRLFLYSLMTRSRPRYRSASESVTLATSPRSVKSRSLMQLKLGSHRKGLTFQPGSGTVRTIGRVARISDRQITLYIVKPTDETTQHKNHRVWRVATGEEVISFVQKSLDNWLVIPWCRTVH